MSRTIPATFDTEASNNFGKPLVLHKISNIFTPIYVTSGGDNLTFDSQTYRAFGVGGLNGGIGPEIDWRGGLAAVEPYELRIIQGGTDLSGGGTTEHPERAMDLRGHIEYDTGDHDGIAFWIQDDTGGELTVYAVFDDGTPTLAESITIFTGNILDWNERAYGPLTLSIGSSLQESVFKRKYLNRFGQESSGDENYDTDRGISDVADGQSVPIVYGVVPYAQGFMVHTEPTEDESDRAGLVLCFSDVRWATKHQQDGDEITLYVHNTEDDRMDEVIRVLDTNLDNLDPASGVQHEVYDTAGSYPTSEAQLDNGGAFVRFHESEFDNSTGKHMASGGNLVIKRLHDLTGVVESQTGGGGAGHTTSTDTDITTATDGDTSTSWNCDGTESGSAYDGKFGRFIEWRIPNRNFPGRVIRTFLKVKYAHTGGTYRTTQAFIYGLGSPNENSLTTYGNSSSGWSETGASYNNIDGADGELEAGCELTNGFRLTSEIYGGSIAVGIYDPNLDDTADYPTSTDFYAAQAEVWNVVGWDNLPNQVAGAVTGIDSATHSSQVSDIVEYPGDILYHFVDQVLGESSRIDTTNISDHYTDASGESVKLAFQLSNANQTVETFLDKLAYQSMSWIVPGDDGKIRIFFRPTMTLSYQDAEDPITEDHVIQDSMVTGLTDRSDLYAGFIVNYGLNYVSKEYDSQYRIMQTSHHMTTNVSSSTDYVAIVDALPSTVDQVLEVDADLIQDAATAEKLCKWLCLQYTRRRQTFNFDLMGFEWAKLQPGDVVALVHPSNKPKSWGDVLFNHLSGAATRQAGSVPNDGANLVGVEYQNDVCVMEGSGVNAGATFRVSTSGSGDAFAVDSNHTIANQSGTPEPYYVIPSIDILSAKIVERSDGFAVRVKAVEHGVIRGSSIP